MANPFETSNEHETQLSPPTNPGRSDAPIMRLADEILTSIFLSGLFDLVDRSARRSYRQNVMLVARRWCTVVLDTPAFWTFIEIAKGILLSVLELHLKRSRILELDVFICEWSGVELCLKLIISHAARWRSFNATLINDMPFTFPHSVSVPRLQHINIYKASNCYNYNDQMRSDRFSIFSHGAPRLETLHLEGVSPCWCIGLGAVKYLRLHNINPWLSFDSPNFSEIFPKLTSLTELTVTGTLHAYFIFPIELPVLRSIQIEGGYDTTVTAFLQYIAAPHLEIVILNDTTDKDFAPLFWPPAPSFPTVRSFTLERTTIQPETFIVLSRVFPGATHVSTLSVSTAWRNTAMSASITWPALHTLTVYPFDRDIRDYIIARNPDRPVSKLRIFEDGFSVGPELRERLLVETVDAHDHLTIEKHTEAAYRMSDYRVRDATSVSDIL